MRLASIAIVLAVTFTAAPSAASTVLADPNHVVSVAAPAERNAGPASAAVPADAAWYRDPITITLAVVGLFALIDLSLLLTEHRRSASSRHARQQRSDYRRA